MEDLDCDSGQSGPRQALVAVLDPAYTVSGISVLYLSEAEIVKYNWIIGYIVLERPKYGYRKETFFIENLMIVNLDA